MRNNVTQQKVRQLVERALAVLARQSQFDVTIAAYNDTLPEVAKTYIALYDEALSMRMAKKVEVTDGHRGVAELARRIRAWSGMLEQFVPGFTIGENRDGPVTRDQVIVEVRRILAKVEQHPQSFGPALVADLTPLLEVAEREWEESKAAQARMQELQVKVRDQAKVARRTLGAFRKALRETLGTAHPDYKSLRISRGSEVEDEEIEGVTTATVAGGANRPASDGPPTNGQPAPGVARAA